MRLAHANHVSKDDLEQALFFLKQLPSLHTKLASCYQLVGKKRQYGGATRSTAAVGVCGTRSFS